MAVVWMLGLNPVQGSENHGHRPRCTLQVLEAWVLLRGLRSFLDAPMTALLGEDRAAVVVRRRKELQRRLSPYYEFSEQGLELFGKAIVAGGFFKHEQSWRHGVGHNAQYVAQSISLYCV